MNIYSIPSFFSSVIFIFVGVFVLRESKRSFPTTFAFFLNCFATFWWQFSWFILFNIYDAHFAKVIIKIGYSGIIFIPVTFFHFYSNYLNILN